MAVKLYINIAENTQSVANNSTNITVSVWCKWSAGSYNKNSPAPAGWLKIDGDKYEFRSTFNDNRTASGTKTLFTKTVDVSHDSEGVKTVYCSAYFATGVSSGNITANASLELTDIPRYAIINSAPNFNDEENPKITYSNPAGKEVTSLQACISLSGETDDVAYRDIEKTGTSYTFELTDAERDVLRAATTDGNSRPVTFSIRTVIEGSSNDSSLSRTLTIKDPNPLINPTIKDINSITLELTGDENKLIRYYSNAFIDSGIFAVKKSEIVSQKVSCGSESSGFPATTFMKVASDKFVITATDSRGNTTSKTYTSSDENPLYSFVKYIKPTCNLANNIPDGEGNMTVGVSGNYFNGSFGAKSNSLVVYFRYKPYGGTYGSWAAMTTTLSGNTYSATANITGLDYQSAYIVQAYAEDELSAKVYSVEKTVKATPVFEWSQRDFSFNVPVSMTGNQITDLADPTSSGDAVPLGYAQNTFLKKDGNQTLAGNLNIQGTVRANSYAAIYGTDGVPRVVFRDESGNVDAQIRVVSTNNKMYFYEYSPDNAAFESYALPAPESITNSATYEILTSKTHGIVKLWENASPTSAFTEQTLTVSGLSNCDMVILVFNALTTSAPHSAILVVPLEMTGVNHYVTQTRYDSGNYTSSRGVTVNFAANTVVFGSGEQNGSNNTSRMIPLYIYGIKGVS